MPSLTDHSYKKCKTPGCTAEQKARGRCSRCYHRLRYRGKLQPVRPPSNDSLASRFWDKVDRREEDECWEWTGSKRQPWGYGSLTYKGQRYSATHISWFLHHGEWPSEIGLWALHKCDNPPCVNPAHLFMGSAADNMTDMCRKNRNRQPAGAEHYKAKLTESDVREVRRLLEAGEPVRLIARRFGVTTGPIYGIARGETWRSVK